MLDIRTHMIEGHGASTEYVNASRETTLIQEHQRLHNDRMPARIAHTHAPLTGAPGETVGAVIDTT